MFDLTKILLFPYLHSFFVKKSRSANVKVPPKPLWLLVCRVVFGYFMIGLAVDALLAMVRFKSMRFCAFGRMEMDVFREAHEEKTGSA